jgi:CHRD domain
MRGHDLIEAAVVAGFIVVWGGAAHADGGGAGTEEFAARLNGFNVTGGLNAETGAILTDGTGTFQLVLDKKSQMATYTLTYSGLTSAVTQAHIHFGKVHVPGGIMVWLCQTAAKPSPVAGTPFCPAAGGSVSGTITAASIIAISGQNVPAGNFDAFTDALGSHTAYANVHTVNFPGGEIRGQVRKSEEHRD